MKRKVQRWLVVAGCVLCLGFAGCGAKDGPTPVTGDAKSLSGSGNYDNMPPEARAAMEAAKAKASTGPAGGKKN